MKGKSLNYGDWSAETTLGNSAKWRVPSLSHVGLSEHGCFCSLSLVAFSACQISLWWLFFLFLFVFLLLPDRLLRMWQLSLWWQSTGFAKSKVVPPPQGPGGIAWTTRRFLKYIFKWIKWSKFYSIYTFYYFLWVMPCLSWIKVININILII